MVDALVMLAEGLADEFRPDQVSAVDPTALAACLGVRVELRAMARSVLGAAPSAARIVINDALDDPGKRFVIAHELAHVLVKRGRICLADPRSEERFADAFAAALVMPRAAFAEVVDVEDAARRLRVDPGIVAARMAELSLELKPRVA